MEQKRVFQKMISAVTVLCVTLVTISGAIAAPILFRPFYYMQIGPLALCAKTGLTENAIREAFDEVMDFLVCGGEFGTGVLAYTAEGKSHFEDCRSLFLLDFWVLGVSAALLLLLLVWRFVQKKRDVPQRPAKHLSVFWSAVAMCVIFAALAVWGAVDFDSLFVAFHAAFFPGKSNWLFDPRYDQIINILPQQFFLNCAILIAGLIFVAVAVFFIADAVWQKRKRS